MAFSGPQMSLTGVTASADLSAKQFYFVKMSGEKTVTVCAGATDKPIGVLQNNPESGEEATVCVVGMTKVSGDADLDYGMLIGTSGDGQADAKTPGTDTTEYICGQVIAGNGAAGGLITAFVNCANIGRGA
jgi:hypothetical protein